MPTLVGNHNTGRTRMLPPKALVELALTYRVRPFLDHLDEASTPSTVFPISRCSLDILLMIFQELVDEEAASYKDIWFQEEIKPRIAPLVALVCKHWKDVVYNTPSLWAVVVIDVIDYVTEMLLWTHPEQTRHYIERAKGGPVDLYLFRYPPPLCSEMQVTTSILSIVPNIRKLYVQFVSSLEPPLLLSRAWPALQNTRELAYSTVQRFNLVTVDLTAHLRGMPRLNTLLMDESKFVIPRRNGGSPLLPQLKVLSLKRSPERSDWDEAARLTSFLSHAPRIEELEVAVRPWEKVEMLDPPSSSPAFILPHLHTVNSKGTAVIQPLLNQEVGTPAITSLALLDWKNNHTPTHSLAISSWFIHASNTLTTLVLFVLDSTQHHDAFASLVQLHTLSLIGDGSGKFLAPFYEPLESGGANSSNTGTICLPSLRFLILSICRPLISEYFEKLVTARCIPVDRRRTTTSGYAALENFVIIALNATVLLNHATRTSAWDAAAVRSKGAVFELRWEFWEAEEAEPEMQKWNIKGRTQKQG